jgi:DNA polymerase-3 subunit gamma/tau
MAVLARAWQMLLKGLEEVQSAPSPAQAAAMVLVRLAYVAELPVPADLVRTLTAGAAANRPAGQPISPIGGAPGMATSSSPGRTQGDLQAAPSARPVSTTVAAAARQPAPEMAPQMAPETTLEAPPGAGFDPVPQSFAETIALFDTRREALIRAHLWSHVHLVSFQPGRIEFRKDAGAPDNLANRVSQLLSEWTGTRWLVAYSEEAGAPTLAEVEAQRESALRNEVASHPLVRAVLETFPGAMIAAVRERFAAADAGVAASDDAEDGGDADDASEGRASTGEGGS